jgi:hypothetical protein
MQCCCCDSAFCLTLGVGSRQGRQERPTVAGRKKENAEARLREK